ncbi:MAG: MATE family efflux transporter [Bilophila sp.]
MSENAHALSLGTEPVGTLLLRYSLPAIAAMVVFSLYNIVDSIFIGHGVGSLALSGLAVTFPIMNLAFAFCLLVGVGGASICSIRMGQKDMDGAVRVLGTVLVLSVINGFVFGALALVFLDSILILFGASAVTLPYARDFMQVILLGLPITYVMFGLNHVMRATGYPQKAMLSAVVTVGVNSVLAPLFIFWLGWGIRGAALATVLSQFVGMLWVLSHFMRPDSFVRFQPGIYKLRKRIILSIFSIGMAPFLLYVCGCIVVAIINTDLSTYGGDMAIGAFGILNRVLILFVMVVIGLTQGIQPIVGYNYGAKQLDRVKLALKYGIFAGVGITTFGLLAAELFPESIARMFTDDEALIALTVRGLRVATLAFPLVGCQIVISNFFQSIGRAKLSVFLSLTRQLLFLVPCLLILPFFWGLDGIWISMPLSDALAFLTSTLVLTLFLKELRKKHESGTPAG